MNNPAMAIEKYQRLKAINPDGQYCITINAAGYYRVEGVDEAPTHHIEIETLLPHLPKDAMTDFLEDY